MKLAFVFPGQGSQSVGMLNAWAEFPWVQDLFETANQALGQNLTDLIAQGPDTDLNLTTNTQPAMLLASYIMYQAYIQAGGDAPAIVAGHSLGEYSALTAVGTFSLADALRLVRVRADAMQAQVPVGVGGMAAIIGLDDDTVRAICALAAQQEVVQAVNFNAPSQVVIAGHKAAVERACVLAKEQGAKRALVLPVSAPFHSTLLQPVGQVLTDFMQQISVHAPQIPVVNNVDVAIEQDPARIVDALARQAWHPVRWVDTIRLFAQQGVTHVVECGPGKVLSGLMKRIDASMTALSIQDPASLEAALTVLKS